MTSFASAWRALDDGRHRAELYRLWHAGADAGFTVPQALETMGARAAADAERVRRWMLDGTRRGAGVADLARAPSAPLSAFERGLLVLGDETGTFAQSLRLLATFFERKHALMLRVRKRMAYPLFTGLLATFIAPFPLLWMGHGRAYLIAAGGGCALWAIAGGSIVLAAAERFGRAPALVRARFARALATAVEAGLPLGRAALLAADASADDALARHVRGIGERRLSDGALAESLAGAPHLTPDLLAILANAERTGDYANTLSRLADQYEDGFR